MNTLHNTYNQTVLFSDSFIGKEPACDYGKEPF